MTAGGREDTARPRHTLAATSREGQRDGAVSASSPPVPQALALLRRWARAAEVWWIDLPGGRGCYGTGYNAWGVQTNQKYLAALAALATAGDEVDEAAAARAVAALRFSLDSHVSGGGRCLDGAAWGHTWISALGVERMMFAVPRLAPWLTEADQAALRAMLTSEAGWLADHLEKGSQRGVVADRWNHTGRNVPESNLWNGALLWRTAALYPDEPEAEHWREEAHRFLLNAVSVAADAADDTPIAGRPVREWHVGANFFDHYALDHHGYLNVGYQVICVSNAAMLHFDLKALGLAAPESLYWHQADLWAVLRRTIFADGRLARIGGDSRLRYTYCQEYLLPALLFAQDRLGEAHAADLVAGQVATIAREAEHHGDGSFYGRRFGELSETNPYYYTRLEADRACALAQLACYAPLTAPAPPAAEGFEASVAGGWAEPEHGAVLHRSPTRLASFAWRAYGLAQGLCQPPGDGDLAEWSANLGGLFRFPGGEGEPGRHRRLDDQQVVPFEGGFVTAGRLTEGCKLTLAEGWQAAESVRHHLAFAALPDGHTVVGLQRAVALDHRVYVSDVQGLHLNLPNDLFNGFERRLVTELGPVVLRRPIERPERIDLGRWACLPGAWGVCGLGDGATLCVRRAEPRLGGPYRSLYVEELAWGGMPGTRAVDAGAELLDVAWAVTTCADGETTAALAASAEALCLGPLRGAWVTGRDGVRYLVLANLSDEPANCPASALWDGALRDQATGQALAADDEAAPGPASARVFLPV